MNDVYQTKDFLTACVLLLRKHRMIDADRTNPRRVVFVFEDSARLREDLDLLNNHQLTVDPLDFWAAERRCKQLIYDGETL